MNQNVETVKQKINDTITEMSDHYWLFSNNPGHDFTRQNAGKLSFMDTIRLVLSLNKENYAGEMMNFFNMKEERMPSESAIIQRRSQIKLEAFQYLFDEFTTAFPQTTHQFKNRCILAADGCHVVYATNAEILEDFNKPRLINYKGHNHMHLNAFVDVVSKAVLDVVIQPGQSPNERQALRSMLEHFHPDNPESYIITADRGYDSYDLIFQCMLKNLSYVFRMKDPSSSRSMLSSYAAELPDDQEEFDVTIRRYFTDKYTNIMKEQKDVYHYMNPSKTIPHFQELLGLNHIVYIEFRVVKFKTAPDTYEYVITNLPSEFDLDDIKECYHWRWGIETSFRYLKHAAGLLYFHSRKPDFLKQEIYACLVMYNFGVFLANEAARENRKKKRKPDNKYLYEIDFSVAINAARKYFFLPDVLGPVDIIKLLCRFVHAVKEKFRQFPRPLRGIGAIRFAYR